LAREQERIFERCWLYIGHESEFRQPGDYRRRTVAGRPLFLVRGRDQQVRAFHNTCTHRGAMVCRQDQGRAEQFQCFYHAWTFDNRGELIGTPDPDGYPPGFDRAERALRAPPRVACYRGLYFISFDPAAPDLVDYLAGARELIDALKRSGHPVILASSAKPDELDHYLDQLDARELADGWTHSGDVERTKPHPDLVSAAVEKAGGGDAVMVGDSTWDCRAAANACLSSIGVLTGGFSEQELSEAGAAAVFNSVVELRENLAETPLGN
jgi:phosphoglycolate phosphatase-like HAD superfamily hydrolase